MYKVGDQFTTKYGTSFIIVELSRDIRNKTVYVIEFPCGMRRTVYYHNIKQNKIKYPYDRSVAGVGYLGLASQKNNEKLYHIWRSILRRCYDKRRKDYPRYGGLGVTVSEEWHSFENFLRDVPTLPGWDKQRFDLGELQLDKDLLSKETKKYSKETCCFLTAKDNSCVKIKDKVTRDFIAISPNGSRTRETSIKEFSDRVGLHASNVCNCLAGRYKSSKGWRFIDLEKGGRQ